MSFKNSSLYITDLILDISLDISVVNSFSFSLNNFRFSSSLALFFFKFNQYFILSFDPIVNLSKRYPFSFLLISFTLSIKFLFSKTIFLEISLYLLFLFNLLIISS